MKIKYDVEEYYYECGDGCCQEWGVHVTFHYDGKEYEYRNETDEDTAIARFTRDILKIEFERI